MSLTLSALVKVSSSRCSAVIALRRFSSAYSGYISQKQSSQRFSSHPIIWLKSSLFPHFAHLSRKGQNVLWKMMMTSRQSATEHQSTHSGSLSCILIARRTWSTSITTASSIVALRLPSEWAIFLCEIFSRIMKRRNQYANSEKKPATIAYRLFYRGDSCL